MILLIHDLKGLDEDIVLKNTQGELTIVSDNGKIRPCICCFDCWIKTPGQCIAHDHYNHMGKLFSKAEELIIISRCFYGSYSPSIHGVLDRGISYMLPYFKTENKETHHSNRYDNHFIISAHFYGRISEKEKETAKKLIKANGINLFARETKVHFYETSEEILEAL
ncbi:MAG: flavodoxin family protein [Betaproteobacteria bacterium]|nr:flavodoxin family protein [Betaproteobacteria bacterium]